MNSSSPSLQQLANEVKEGKTTSRQLVEDCLSRIEVKDSVCLYADAQCARQAADAMDQLRSAGAAPSPFVGIPISVKDLFDVQEQITAAGPRVLSQ